MAFVKYQHVEKFGTSEVENIEIGECYVFPKIDGTNGSLWWDDGLCAGSRRRQLSLDDDNAGFFEWASNQHKFFNFFEDYHNVRLFGEWLVPHSLKTYKEDSWRNFYVFDVVTEDRYLPYEEYKPMLEKFNIDYIPPICKIRNGSYEQFVKQLHNNVFLIEDGKGVGEGIVIKRYDFVNRYGRTTWAKIVTSEFKEKHARVMGPPEVECKKMIEEDIVNEFVTKALVDKVYANIANEDGWRSKFIPRLLNTVYYDLVREESWSFVKKYKNPTINFKTLNYLTVNRVKEVKPELF